MSMFKRFSFPELGATIVFSLPLTLVTQKRPRHAPLDTVPALVVFDHSDAYVTYMPIFTEWFVPATFCYCDIGAGGKPCLTREQCDDRRELAGEQPESWK